MIKNKVLDNLVGPMEDAIKVNGKTVNRMEREPIEIKMEYRKMVFG